MTRFFQQWLSAEWFCLKAKRWSLWLGCMALGVLIYGLWGALFTVPADAKQGEAFRIMYVHVPSAFLSMGIYFGMACAALLALIWRIKLADIWVEASAPVGAMFTALALLTGMLWGKPMWGTWWIWDARLTSELLLFFLYCGAMTLRQVGSNSAQGQLSVNVLVLMGILNLPIIHFSVQWWQTLHQGPSIARFAMPAIAPVMLYPLIAMLAGTVLFTLSVIFRSMCSIILMRERHARWVQAGIK